ncbi:MAG: hypothetical protein JXB04_06460 [Kiritimatiellae bacterium]|nr:hypothetical protein [Kiritimatiellia bacterium]
MKRDMEFIALALAFGVIMWIVDAFLDYFLFYYINNTFIEVLILDMPPRSAYTRSIVIMGFLIFGMIAAKSVDTAAKTADRKQEE